MLRSLTDGVWDVQDVIRLPGGIRLPARTTVLRDRDGGLLVYGPLALDDGQAAAIDAVGEVRTLLAPNLYHHLYLRQAKERWPDATLLAVPGLAAKRATLSFDGLAEDGEVAPGLRLTNLQGMPKINEAVVVHEPSGTLVCADLVFRIRDAKGFSKLVFKMMGDYGETLMCGRIWRFSVKERSAYEASLNTLLAHDFDGVVMAHGDPVMEGGRAQLEAVVR